MINDLEWFSVERLESLAGEAPFPSLNTIRALARIALAAKSANHPVIPDGWIKCSEMMPDVGDIVITSYQGGVNVGLMERSGANYRYFTSIISGRELPSTHWMPLPGAPALEEL